MAAKTNIAIDTEKTLAADTQPVDPETKTSKPRKGAKRAKTARRAKKAKDANKGPGAAQQ